MNIYDLHHRWVERKKRKEEEKRKKMEEKLSQEDSVMETEEEQKEVTTKPEGTEGQKSETPHDPDVIDLRVLWKKICQKKKWYFIVLPIVFVLSTLYIFNQPRYFTTQTTMAPEIDLPTGSGSSLSNIASSLGFDVNQAQTTDAIQPSLYPDLMTDNGFVTALFNIQITTVDDTLQTSYYNYLRYHQQQSWLDKHVGGIGKAIGGLFVKKTKPDDNKKGAKFDPYHLSKIDDDIAQAVRGNVSIDIDKKTGVIQIDTKAQDPVVCQVVADSVRNRLQAFITRYRTNKCRRDVEYYEKLTSDAKAEYEKTRNKYATISDENMDLLLETEKSKIEDLENTMQLQYNNYTAMQTQLQAARAKLRQYTPVFTTIEGAAVPVKPAGPKRMVFIAAMLLLTIVIQTIYFVKDEIFSKK